MVPNFDEGPSSRSESPNPSVPISNPTSGTPRKGEWLLALFLCGVFLARLIHVAWDASPTFDEPKHLLTGEFYLAHGWCCFGKDNTPLVALNALPLYCQGKLPQFTEQDPQELKEFFQGSLSEDELRWRYFWARLPNLLIAAGLALGLYRWVRSMAGGGAANAALFFLACSPNLAAYGGLVNPDFQVAAFMFLGSLVFSDLLTLGWSKRRFVAASALGALAILAKYTGLILFVAVGLAVLLALVRRQFGRSGSRTKGPLWAPILALATGGTLVLGAYDVLSWVGGLKGLGFFPFDTARPSTSILTSIDKPPHSDAIRFGFFGGLDEVRRISGIGFDAFFFGDVAKKFLWFYPAVVALKTPIALAIAAGLGAVWVLKNSALRGRWGLPTLVVVGLFGAAMTSHMCLGVRHILALYPLLIALAGLGIAWGFRGPQVIRGATILLLLWMGFSGFRYHPQHLAYFNEIAGGPEGGVRYFADANLDWGQDLYRLRDELEERGIEGCQSLLHAPFPSSWYGVPTAMIRPGQPIPKGWVAVSASRLVGLGIQDIGSFVVRDFFGDKEPVARIGFSIFLYDLSEPPANEPPSEDSGP